jgi:hypothetical protein
MLLGIRIDIGLVFEVTCEVIVVKLPEGSDISNVKTLPELKIPADENENGIKL